ncbi:MAG: metallophosphoesterase [Ilumatobacteraceae bacterium]
MTRIAQLTDLHLASDGSERAAMARRGFEAAVRAVGDHGVDALVLTGDLLDDEDPRSAALLADTVRTLGVPVLCTPGNHDLPRTLQELFGSNRRLDLGPWRVLAAPTFVPDAIHGEIDPEGVCAELDEAPDRPTVLALHHPPVGTSTNEIFQLRNGGDLLAGLLVRPWVRAVISGHLHEAFHLRAGHLELLGGPSTYRAMRHLGDRHDYPADGLIGARLLDLGRDGRIESTLLST